MSNLPQRVDDGSAHRNVGHEVSVHHIHVHAIGPGLLNLGYLLTESGKVGSENRRSQSHCVFGHFHVILFCFHEWRLDLWWDKRYMDQEIELIGEAEIRLSRTGISSYELRRFGRKCVVSDLNAEGLIGYEKRQHQGEAASARMRLWSRGCLRFGSAK